MFVVESEVGPRSSEVQIPQVEQEVVVGEGDPQSTPPIDMADVDTVIDLSSVMVTHSLVSSDRPDPPPEAMLGSVDVPVRPDQANNSLQHINSNGRQM